MLSFAQDPPFSVYDDDHHAYTYLRVSGDDIEVLERGGGHSPWDPRRVIVDDPRPPIRWSE